jgi:hypothetical protein
MRQVFPSSVLRSIPGMPPAILPSCVGVPFTAAFKVVSIVWLHEGQMQRKAVSMMYRCHEKIADCYTLKYSAKFSVTGILPRGLFAMH